MTDDKTEKVATIVETCDGVVMAEYWSIYDHEYEHWLTYDQTNGQSQWSQDPDLRWEFETMEDAQLVLDSIERYRNGDATDWQSLGDDYDA